MRGSVHSPVLCALDENRSRGFPVARLELVGPATRTTATRLLAEPTIAHNTMAKHISQAGACITMIIHPQNTPRWRLVVAQLRLVRPAPLYQRAQQRMNIIIHAQWCLLAWLLRDLLLHSFSESQSRALCVVHLTIVISRRVLHDKIPLYFGA